MISKKLVGLAMNPEEMPEQASTRKRNLWQQQINIPSRILKILCLLCVLVAWGIVILKDYPLRIKYELFLYLAFWSSVGSLIGLVISKKSDRGLFWGAIIGAVLAAVLMC
jgi:hypothetical protein